MSRENQQQLESVLEIPEFLAQAPRANPKTKFPVHFERASFDEGAGLNIDLYSSKDTTSGIRHRLSVGLDYMNRDFYNEFRNFAEKNYEHKYAVLSVKDLTPELVDYGVIPQDNS